MRPGRGDIPGRQGVDRRRSVHADTKIVEFDRCRGQLMSGCLQQSHMAPSIRPLEHEFGHELARPFGLLSIPAGLVKQGQMQRIAFDVVCVLR
ncbi:hypothetical protein [Dokdonella sp.]|uniref:hypothetical protein n=1 Tax=Dokdonella sp. TaxID=2291710 RepID=UPI003528E1C1